jgi:hypothetical protein
MAAWQMFVALIDFRKAQTEENLVLLTEAHLLIIG